MNRRPQRHGARRAMGARGVGVIPALALLAGLFGPWALAVAASAPAGPAYDPTEEIARIQAEIAANGYGWTAGETSMMRMPPAERGQWLGGVAPAEASPPAAGASAAGDGTRDLPAVWDWRAHGGVTPAKSQGGCGSCWAFAAVGALEAAVRIDSGRIVDLSEQQVLACSSGSDGCSAGTLPNALEVLVRRSSVSEACLPYEASDDVPCQYDCRFIAYADGYAPVAADIPSLKQSVYQRPLVAGMRTYSDFYAYTGGCYEHAGSDLPNHDVLVVGWDDTACGGAGAWICKNSWGGQWGIDGFFYLRYGSCQLGSYAYAIQYSPNASIFLHHVPLEDSWEQPEPYEVRANLATRDFPLDPSTLFLQYRYAYGSTWNRVPLLALPYEFPESYRAHIPPPTWPTTVYYWLSVADLGGNQRVAPAGAPDTAYSFQALFTPTAFQDDVETGWHPWSLSAPDDDATAGRWERGEPEGTLDLHGYPCNPPEDHTPAEGVNCFCTGLLEGINYMQYDVDGGKTTLTSPRIEMSWATVVRLDYYRWFSNGADPHPDDDYWQVDVSDDDGATWVSLEYTNEDDPSWQLRSFELGDYIAMTDSVRLRFIASDYGPASIVEAAVDDILVLATAWDTQAADPGAAPARGLRLTADPVPATSAVRLRIESDAARRGGVWVFAPDGRPVRRLGPERIGAGLRTLVWDGRDDAGRPVASGVYFLRMAGEGTPVARVVLLR